MVDPDHNLCSTYVDCYNFSGLIVDFCDLRLTCLRLTVPSDVISDDSHVHATTLCLACTRSSLRLPPPPPPPPHWANVMHFPNMRFFCVLFFWGGGGGMHNSPTCIT